MPTNKFPVSCIKYFAILFLTLSLFTIFLLALSLLALSYSNVSNGSLTFAQTPLDQAKKDYTEKTSDLSNTKNAYITAKSTYQAFGTATAKAEAFAKTKEYLISVDRLLLSYLALVSEYGSETRWQSSSFNKAATDQVITDQITFMQDHLEKVQNTQTLEELPPLSLDLKTRLDKDTRPKINKVAETYDIAQTESIFGSFINVSQLLNEFVEKRITAQNHTLLINWQSEINDIREKTLTNLSLSKESYKKIKDDSFNSHQIKQTDEILERAKIELKRSKSLFEEMTKII